jgi:hypothetical protein
MVGAGLCWTMSTRRRRCDVADWSSTDPRIKLAVAGGVLLVGAAVLAPLAVAGLAIAVVRYGWGRALDAVLGDRL